MTRLLLLAALVAAAPTAFAQATFGLKAGLNVATIIPDNDEDLADRGAKLGFTGGVFAEVPVASGFSLQPEVLYTQKGVSRDEPNESIGVDYLEIPVLAKVALPVSEFLDLDVYAGPALAVKLQETFGMAETPRVLGGRVPVVMHLLSPARRPVQVTTDLASFWETGYFDVRKDLRGRYPKHPWPEDPLTATATARTKRRR